ncbi:UNVERIFIED_CONTAM: hypothetical protein K2H54_037627 [Gekko kuhli]
MPGAHKVEFRFTRLHRLERTLPSSRLNQALLWCPLLGSDCLDRPFEFLVAPCQGCVPPSAWVCSEARPSLNCGSEHTLASGRQSRSGVKPRDGSCPNVYDFCIIYTAPSEYVGAEQKDRAKTVKPLPQGTYKWIQAMCACGGGEDSNRGRQGRDKEKEKN